MFVLKCSLCGWEQIVKKRIEDELYYELTHAEQLWCPCNKCKNSHPRIVPEGFIEHDWCFGQWSAILTMDVGGRAQSRGLYGSWSKVVNPSISHVYSVQRAKEMRDIGMKILSERKQSP